MKKHGVEARAAALFFCFALVSAWVAAGAEESAMSAVPYVPPWLGKKQQERIWDALPAKPTVAPAKARRVLVFSRSVHPGAWAGLYAFQALGVKSGAYQPVYSDDPAALSQENLAGFDAVVFNNTPVPYGEETAQGVIRYVEEGGGIVGTHTAVLGQGPHMEYRWLWGAGYAGYPWHEEIGIKHEEFAVKADSPRNPLLAAFEGQAARVCDEIYQFCDPYSRWYVHVLLTVDVSAGNALASAKAGSIIRTDNDFALAWLRKVGKGRLFYCALGHEDNIFSRPDFMRFYLDAVQFAVGDYDVPAAPSAWGAPLAGGYDIEAVWAASEKAGPGQESVLREQCPMKFLDSDAVLKKIAFLKAIPAYAAAGAVKSKLVAALGDELAQVRMAAVEGLAMLKDAAVLPRMVEALAGVPEPERRLGRAALARMGGGDIEKAMLELARNKTFLPEARAETVAVLAMRGAPGAAPAFLELARDDAPAVRLAALEALRKCAGADAVEALVGLVKDARDAGGREAAAAALACALQRGGAPQAEVKKIAAALGDAPAEARLGLMQVLGRLGGEEALLAIMARFESDKDEAVRVEALKLLAAWPEPAPMEKLLAAARGGADEQTRALALAGYIRMTGLALRNGAISAAEAVEKYEQAISLADRREEEIAALKGLARVKDVKALRFLEQYLEETALLGDESLLEPAERAYVEVAISLAAEYPGESKAALKQFSVSSQNKELVERANRTLEWLK